MKLRVIVLASAAALALMGSAAASDSTGWYVGLGAGWSHFGGYTAKTTTPFGTTVATPTTTNYPFKADDSVLLLGAFGYRFDNRFRIENEISWSNHDVHVDGMSGFSGHVEPKTDFVNLMYDLPLGPRWGLTMGGGAGAAAVGMSASYNGIKYLSDSKIRFAAQGIVGIN